MPRPTVPPAGRVLCAFLAVMAGAFAVRVVVTGELATRGGVAPLTPAGAWAVGGVLATLAVGAAWAAVTGRGG